MSGSISSTSSSFVLAAVFWLAYADWYIDAAQAKTEFERAF
jgi:hypothetical protein